MAENRMDALQVRVTTRNGVKAILDAIAAATGITTQSLVSQLVRAHCGKPHVAPALEADEVYSMCVPWRLPSEERVNETWTVRLTSEEVAWLEQASPRPGDGGSVRGRLVYALTRAAGAYDSALVAQLERGELRVRRGRPPGVARKKSHGDAICG